MYPVPPFRIVTASTPPLVTASIFEICLISSYDSTTKSFPANFSSTLYGKVFLLNPELLKSKSWFKIWFSAINGERYVLPIKYGYTPSILFVPVPNPTVAKYAYTPLGNSGVFPNLPLWTSKSPEPSNILSSTKNPAEYPGGRLFTLLISVLYEDWSIFRGELILLGSE